MPAGKPVVRIAAAKPVAAKATPMKMPPVKMAPVKITAMKISALKTASAKSVPMKTAIVKTPIVKAAMAKSVLVKTAPANAAPVKAAVVKAAPVKAAPVKAAPKAAPTKALVASAPVKSAVARPQAPSVMIKPAVPLASVPTNGKPRKNQAGLNARELETFRTLLLEKRRQIVGDVSSMERDALNAGGGSNLSNLPLHMADMGTDNYEQEFTLGLMEKDRKLLKEINHALAKIQDGSYGMCEGTGQAISKVRLEAQPWARFSIEYARKLEHSGVGRTTTEYTRYNED